MSGLGVVDLWIDPTEWTHWDNSHSSLCCPTDTTMKEMFYLTMHSTHFIYSYMALDTW